MRKKLAVFLLCFVWESHLAVHKACFRFALKGPYGALGSNLSWQRVRQHFTCCTISLAQDWLSLDFPEVPEVSLRLGSFLVVLENPVMLRSDWGHLHAQPPLHPIESPSEPCLPVLNMWGPRTPLGRDMAGPCWVACMGCMAGSGLPLDSRTEAKWEHSWQGVQRWEVQAKPSQGLSLLWAENQGCSKGAAIL